MEQILAFRLVLEDIHSNTIIVAIIGLAIALYAFYISIGDQRIFEGKILKDI